MTAMQSKHLKFHRICHDFPLKPGETQGDWVHTYYFLEDALQACLCHLLRADGSDAPLKNYRQVNTSIHDDNGNLICFFGTDEQANANMIVYDGPHRPFLQQLIAQVGAVTLTNEAALQDELFIGEIDDAEFTFSRSGRILCALCLAAVNARLQPAFPFLIESVRHGPSPQLHNQRPFREATLERGHFPSLPEAILAFDSAILQATIEHGDDVVPIEALQLKAANSGRILAGWSRESEKNAADLKMDGPFLHELPPISSQCILQHHIRSHVPVPTPMEGVTATEIHDIYHYADVDKAVLALLSIDGARFDDKTVFALKTEHHLIRAWVTDMKGCDLAEMGNWRHLQMHNNLDQPSFGWKDGTLYWGVHADLPSLLHETGAAEALRSQYYRTAGRWDGAFYDANRSYLLDQAQVMEFYLVKQLPERQLTNSAYRVESYYTMPNGETVTYFHRKDCINLLEAAELITTPDSSQFPTIPISYQGNSVLPQLSQVVIFESARNLPIITVDCDDHGKALKIVVASENLAAWGQQLFLALEVDMKLVRHIPIQSLKFHEQQRMSVSQMQDRTVRNNNPGSGISYNRR